MIFIYFNNFILFLMLFSIYIYWGLGIGDWGLGIGDWDWAQSPIPNPQSPIPNPHEVNYNFNIY